MIIVDDRFSKFVPKTHEEESPMKSKAQRPAKSTEEQERPKERIARRSDL